MKLTTYEERVAKIFTESDIDDQMAKVKKLMLIARSNSKKTGLLSTKLKWIEKAEHHESVMRQLRINRFDLEDKVKKTT